MRSSILRSGLPGRVTFRRAIVIAALAALAIGVPIASATGPANTGQPQTLGNSADVDNELTLTDGQWATTPDSFTYQWQRCDGAGLNCADIAGATSSPYTIVSADIGHVLQGIVTATTSGGSTSATSFKTQIVGAPYLTGTNTITGDTTVVGSVLTENPGDFDGDPTSYSYQWVRCDLSNSNCVGINGQTASTYTTSSADLSHKIFNLLRATNAVGTSNSWSGGQTAEIGVPALVTPPAVTAAESSFGIAVALVGNTVTVDNGAWLGSGITYSYQWQSCSPSDPSQVDFTGCTNIVGATSASYTPVSADIGHTIQPVVTATASNSGHASASPVSAYSGVYGSVGVPSPVGNNTSVSGTQQVGQTLTANPGTWDGEGGQSAITFTYSWVRCDDVNCTSVGSSPTYALTSADLGSSLYVSISGTNSAGSNGFSSYAGPITVGAAPAPSATSTPTPSAPSTVVSGDTTFILGLAAIREANTTSTGSVTTTMVGTTGVTSTVSVAWTPGSFAVPVTVTATPMTAGDLTDGFAVGSVALSLNVTDASGNAVTSFSSPLLLHFSSLGSQTAPGYSHDGGTWTAIPLLASPSLPAGQSDGYFVYSDGSVDIFTRHATYFGLLKDTMAPSAPGSFSGAFSGGALHLKWSASTDNLAVASYVISMNGVTVATVSGSATSASIRGFAPKGTSTFTIAARDTAGNTAPSSTTVTVVAKTRPASIPRVVPAWAFSLLRAQRAGTARPASAPKHLPAWFAAWKSWHTAPFKLAA